MTQIELIPEENIPPVHLPAPPLLQFFSYEHLDAKLQPVSKPFHDLAQIVSVMPDNIERSACLRRLLEAKDCAVRAFFMK